MTKNSLKLKLSLNRVKKANVSLAAWLKQETFGVVGVLPTLALCFKTNRYAINGISKAINEVGTYARAQANPATVLATVINASGYIENVNADVIRVGRNPMTGAREGILIERDCKNTIRRSEDFSQSNWANLTNASWSLDAAQINPRGILGSYKLVESSATGAHNVFALTNASGTSGCAHSVFLKAAGRTQARLSIWNSTNGFYGTIRADLTTGAIVSSTGTKAQMEQYPNGWWRLKMAATATAVKTEQLYIEIYNGASSSYAGDGTSGIYVFGAQSEEGRAISSEYIWTNVASGSGTRSADDFVLNSISSWYSTTGTLVVRYKAKSVGTAINRSIASIDDGTTANSIGITMNDNASDTHGIDIVNSSASIFSNIIGTYVQGDVAIVAVAFSLNDILAAANEVYGSLSTAGTIPALTRLLLGNNALGAYAGATIQDVLFYPSRVSAVDLLALTSTLTFADMDVV